MEDDVKALLKKAVEANDSADAMRFAQAASNAASALCGLKNAREDN